MGSEGVIHMLPNTKQKSSKVRTLPGNEDIADLDMMLFSNLGNVLIVAQIRAGGT
jgi:hypothetical protein